MVTSRYLLHTLESKGFPLACHNIYPAKIPRGSNVASKAIPRIICYTSALHTWSYNTRSLSHTHAFALTYICIYIYICIFTRIHTYRAGRFPETRKKKSKDRRLWRKEDKLRMILVLLKKRGCLSPCQPHVHALS